MIDSLQAPQRKLLALVLLAASLGLVASVTALPIGLVNAGYQSRLDDLQQRLERYQAIKDQDANLRRSYARLQRTQSSRGYLLRSDSEAVAAAEVQRILKRIADANGTQLVSTQIVQKEPAEDDTLVPVALQVRARGSLSSIVESAYALETNPVLLFLDEFSIRIASTRRVRGQPPIRNFEADFQLVGYMTELQ